MDLFDYAHREKTGEQTPLAARMRPRTLDEFIGQDIIVGPGRLLRRAIQADQLSSLIFFGPPGTGKTTLAQIIANTTQAHFVSLNAVLSGVKEIREAVQEASLRRKDFAQRTILFIDEVHRFNKAQQDALLPWVENGTVILIGATTENPYFEVNKALVSRSRLFQLRKLDEPALQRVAQQALLDRERGYGRKNISIEPKALAHLVHVANGDARTLLNALELAVETTPADSEGVISISLEVAEESIQQRALLYDKEGDVHFDTISAFIKSLRGSDPDAAIYWLARMVHAGEDPRFLFRRMLIAASEDVGLADPQAIVVVEACAATFDRIGMPEGQFPLAQAALYLATAPKSNSAMGFFDALHSVKAEREDDVPTHLKDASRDKEGSGHGQGYLYPHAYREHWVAQQYLPANMQGQVFYRPTSQGYEASIQQSVSRRREEQFAAFLEGSSRSSPEIWTSSPSDPAWERWFSRTQSQIGAKLGQIRDRMFAQLQCQRHHVVLDLRGIQGLLTWEALRQTPEGGVYSRVDHDADAQLLLAQAHMLPELNRPIPIVAELSQLVPYLKEYDPNLRLDAILGYNVLSTIAEPESTCRAWIELLQSGGRLLLADNIPHEVQRLYRLLDPLWLPDETYQRCIQAEESMYQHVATTTPFHSFFDRIHDVFAAEEQEIRCHREIYQTEVCLSPPMIQRWFSSDRQEKSYVAHLQTYLSTEEIADVQRLFEQRLRGKTVSWHSTVQFCEIHKTSIGVRHNQEYKQEGRGTRAGL